VADFSSRDRRYAEAARVRRLARRDLNAAAREALRCKLAHVLARGVPLLSPAVRCWNDLVGEAR
jgi:HD superfamily phosphohydrolase YqeK